MVSSRGALLHHIRKKMATAKGSKRGKSAKESLEETLDQGKEFLQKMKTPRKKSRYFIFRDPMTGKREIQRSYKPRFQVENQDRLSDITASGLAIDDLDEVGGEQYIQPSTPELVEDTLQATLTKCDEFLCSFDVCSNAKTWESRMSHLTSSWDSSRKQLFEAVLSCEGLPSPDCCSICSEGKVRVRCMECPVKFMCPSCDEKAHQFLPFHNRDGYVNGHFRAIPPTLAVHENGSMQTIPKLYPVVNLPDHCSKCKEYGALQQMPVNTKESLIIVNEKGRFDLNRFVLHCKCCNTMTPSWTLTDVIQSGYWPGSPTDTSYVFDQQLFHLWESLQKRMPGTSETSFIRALEDVSAMRGRAPTINHSTFSRSFKEWKFCQYEINQLQSMDWMKCPTCAISQHSCHVDGNMKLYRYHSSGSQRRPSYYGDLFIANKDNVDTHMKTVYASQPKSKDSDNRCGDSHWRAANNKGKKSAKLDETGLEIAGCRHGLAQWAVNMFQGELYGYANYIHLQKMIPAGVKYFWEDIVCKYWKWARKAGGLDGSDMKPALSVMHAKAHNWTCQVIWGGRWQDGSACSTGEEVEQINSYMSRCGNTTKYMLPENREELITEHALSWNSRKIIGMVQSLGQRYSRAVKMQTESQKQFSDALDTYNVSLAQFQPDEWKKVVTSHAQEVEALRGTSSGVRLQDEIEMLVCNIELTTCSMNKLPDSSRQRTRLRGKITADKTKLSSRIQEYNDQDSTDLQLTCTMPEIMRGNFPWGNNADTPIRIKRIVVEKHEITKRWEEEVSLIKKEMANFIAWYMDITIPQLTKIAEELQAKLNNTARRSSVPTDSDEASVESENATMGMYKTESEDVRVIGGKLACARKGIAFCKGQLVGAAAKFKTALAGSGFEESLNIQDVVEDDTDDDADADDDGEYEDGGDDAANDDSTVIHPPTADHIKVTGETIPRTNVFLWKCPAEVSQSTLDGFNGSSACSVIALVFAHGVWHQRLDLPPTPLLCPMWFMLLCAAIRIGNRLYDRCRHSLPQRFLSASEAATIAERCVSVSVDAPLPVRVFDEHAPTTLLFQLSMLCTGDRGDAAVLIANEKTVLLMPVGNSSIVLVDTHRHGIHGAQVLLGQRDSLDQFVHVCQTVIDLQDDTYANLSFLTF